MVGWCQATLRWQPPQATGRYDVVDLDVELPAGSNNAVQIFLNGLRVCSPGSGRQGEGGHFFQNAQGGRHG
jgi:hypothetical protein